MHHTVVFRTSFKTEHGVLLSFLNFLNNAAKGLLWKWLKCRGQQFYDKNGKIVDLIGSDWHILKDGMFVSNKHLAFKSISMKKSSISK